MRKMWNNFKKWSKRAIVLFAVFGLVACCFLTFQVKNLIQGDGKDKSDTAAWQQPPTATPWPTPVMEYTATPQAWGRPAGDCLVSLTVASPLYAEVGLLNKLVVLVPPGTQYNMLGVDGSALHVSGMSPEGTEVVGYISITAVGDIPSCGYQPVVCQWNPELSANSPLCFEPCVSNAAIAADDPNCP